MMLRILLIRHGETALNQSARFQGQSHLPLSEAGILQAQAVARRLSGQAISQIFSSDLPRARQTAEIIAASCWSDPATVVSRLHLEPRLREIDFGAWEGLTLQEILLRYPDEIAAWQADPHAAPPAGESIVQVIQRVDGWLNELRSRERAGAPSAFQSAHTAGETMLVVAHGGVLQALLCAALQVLPPFWWPFHLYTASISELWLYSQGATLIYLNDLSHLVAAGIDPDSVRGR